MVQEAYEEGKNAMTPTWQSEDGSVQLFHADCRDVLTTLTGIDAVVTDPPFNADKGIENDCMTPVQWRNFCESVADVLYGTNPNNILVEVGKGDKEMHRALDEKFAFRWTLVLNYTNSMRNGAVGYANFGLVLWYGNGKCYHRYKDRLDSELHNTIGEFEHPCPKEITHYAKLIEMFSERRQQICDPFMGSGTTGVACVRTGRRFIGIEINAKKRIMWELAQPKLDLQEPKQPTQGEILFSTHSAQNNHNNANLAPRTTIPHNPRLSTFPTPFSPPTSSLTSSVPIHASPTTHNTYFITHFPPLLPASCHYYPH